MTRRPSWAIEAALILMVVDLGRELQRHQARFDEIPPQPFNAMRLLIASATFYVAIRQAARRARRPAAALPSVFHTPSPLTLRDRVDLVWLGLVGHLAYQSAFAGGVSGRASRTPRSSSAPRPSRLRRLPRSSGTSGSRRSTGLAIAVAALGIYFVVGHERLVRRRQPDGRRARHGVGRLLGGLHAGGQRASSSGTRRSTSPA